jgi:serine/threonine-protein kinase
MSEQTIGRYQILEKVGRGGMGILYRGTDPVLDREVAIKVMSADFSDSDEEARGRFFREARAAARLQHRNIVTVFEFAEENDVPYIVMEFLRGRSLSARMAADPPLTVDQSLDILIQLCTGLQFAHEGGVVHRDVKPGNVWLLEDGTVKLLDFGIAKLNASTFTRRGDVLGSACYMAPEQVSSKPVDGRADVFSAGVVLYEMVARRKPFDADSPTAALLKIVQEDPEPIDQVVPGVPAALVAAIDKALKKNPDERYQTAGDFGNDLYLVRMAMQSSGDTLLATDFTIGDTVRVPGTLTRVVTVNQPGPPTASTPAPTPGTAPQTSVTAVQPQRNVVLQAVVGGAAVVLVVVATWFAATRLGSPPAGAASQQPTTSSQPDKAGAAAGATDAAKRGAAPLERVLHVASEPAGAAIAVDGRATDMVTPADVRYEGGAPPKRLRLTKNGYASHDARLSARELEQGTVSYTLRPPEATLVKVSIAGSYPFQVLDGTREISGSDTSHQVSVPEGHIVALKAENYLLDYKVRIAGGPDRAMEIRAPELGRVTIRSSLETCRVFLNGFDVGIPTISMQMAAQIYSVQLKCPDGQTINGPSIHVLAGQNMTVKVPQ